MSSCPSRCPVFPFRPSTDFANLTVFNTTATIRHASLLPARADTAEAAKAILQDHRAMIECGPHCVDCEMVEEEEATRLAATALASQTEHPLPDEVRTVIKAFPESADGKTFAVYRVTDMVHTLPAGLWDSKVVSTYEMTDTATGVHVRVRSPLSIVMDTMWTVAEVEGGGHELVEEINIYCSRLLVGTVKSLCEGDWEKIHTTLIKRLEE